MRTNAIATFLVSLAVAASPLLANAESVIWSSSSIPGGVPTLGYNPGKAWLRVTQISASVQYGARAYLLDTDGNVVSNLACGSTVPKGSRVAFTFFKHANQDINWFRSGSASDSPYGIWADGASRSYPNACTDEQYYLLTTPNGHRTYVRLVAAPPSENITGVSGCSSYGNNPANRSCVINGTTNATFVFGQTFGYFYADEAVGSSCVPYDGGHPLDSAGKVTYALPIGQETISCPIYASPVPQQEGAAPSSPSVSGGSGSSVAGSAACTTGLPYSITMTATSPQGTQLRYGIDWDGNGIVDQFVPASGYVPSGTAQTASRTFAVAGGKTIKVFAQDANGLISPWTTYTVTCGAAKSTTATSTAIISGNDGNDSGAGASISPALNLRAIPSLVSPGKTSNINWSATNVVSCTVSGDNGDSWTGTVSPVGGQTSAPILKKTVYTLSCKTKAGAALTAKAIVNILPTWVEQ